MSSRKKILLGEALKAAHDDLITKGGLKLIIRSHVSVAESSNVGDLTSLSQRRSPEMGKWSFPRKILSIDTEAGSITVTERAGKMICPAVEDGRAAIYDNGLALALQNSIDELEFNSIAVLESANKEAVCLESVIDLDDDELPYEIKSGHDHKLPAGQSI